MLDANRAARYDSIVTTGIIGGLEAPPAASGEAKGSSKGVHRLCSGLHHGVLGPHGARELHAALGRARQAEPKGPEAG